MRDRPCLWLARPRCDRSAPAQNAGGAPVTTTAPTSGSDSMASNPASISSTSSSVSALRRVGASRVTTATRPLISVRSSGMGRSLPWGRCDGQLAVSLHSGVETSHSWGAPLETDCSSRHLDARAGPRHRLHLRWQHDRRGQRLLQLAPEPRRQLRPAQPAERAVALEHDRVLGGRHRRGPAARRVGKESRHDLSNSRLVPDVCVPVQPTRRPKMKYMLMLRFPQGSGPQEGTREFDREMEEWGKLNEELRAAKMPAADYGSVEIRPLAAVEQSG